MNRAWLENFIVYLEKENWAVFGLSKKTIKKQEPIEILPYLAAHEKIKKQLPPVFIDRINHPNDLLLGGQLPYFSFKKFFLPNKETLFDYRDNLLVEKKHSHRIALFGIGLLDLKAINLYDQVFEKDSYYQARRRNIFIVGHAILPEIEDNIFEYKYEEEVLEHLPFDVFLAETSDKRLGDRYKLFTGSIKGQRILEKFGYKDYEHIQYSGATKERAKDERLERLKKSLKNKHNQKIWDELGKKCLECGKCTLACPTCFCFRVDDLPTEKDHGQRQRCWDSCYFQEFSEVAGGHKFLSTTAQKIHFWYYHKFVRIPEEFDFIGCVGCRRCAKVCPVGIDIKKVLEDVENS